MSMKLVRVPNVAAAAAVVDAAAVVIAVAVTAAAAEIVHGRSKDIPVIFPGIGFVSIPVFFVNKSADGECLGGPQLAVGLLLYGKKYRQSTRRNTRTGQDRFPCEVCRP
jgi:hypothetical protein